MRELANLKSFTATDKQRLTRFNEIVALLFDLRAIRHACKRQVERARVTQARLYALHTSDKNRSRRLEYYLLLQDVGYIYTR